MNNPVLSRCTFSALRQWSQPPPHRSERPFRVLSCGIPAASPSRRRAQGPRHWALTVSRPFTNVTRIILRVVNLFIHRIVRPSGIPVAVVVSDHSSVVSSGFLPDKTTMGTSLLR